MSDLAALRVQETFMGNVGRRDHWEHVYTTKGDREVSWFQENPSPSLELIALAGLSVSSMSTRVCRLSSYPVTA